jgi:hypothetical protein
MAGTDYHCPHCGAELRGDLRRGGSRPGGTPGCPYDGLPPHQPMDFAEWYDVVEVPFREEE